MQTYSYDPIDMTTIETQARRMRAQYIARLFQRRAR